MSALDHHKPYTIRTRETVIREYRVIAVSEDHARKMFELGSVYKAHDVDCDVDEIVSVKQED